MLIIKRAAEAFLNLFYPNLCLACGEQLVKNDILCIRCHYELPLTAQYTQLENAFTERFWGRINIVTGAAMYYFLKESRVRNLIHQLKYEGKQNIGFRLGELFGKQLVLMEAYQKIDVIIPVPLHSLRKRERGYNQSALFARGLARSMGKICAEDLIKRVEYTDTQTLKSREARFKNVENAFEVTDKKKLEGMRILLVDDVMTTGATLEACGHYLLAIPKTEILFVTIAIAS